MKLAERRAIKKKEEILRAAAAIINRDGYAGATMEDIAAELLMTKGALYYYFKNKSELLYECHNLVLGAAIEEHKKLIRKETDIEETLVKMIALHLDYAIEEKEVFNLISKPDQTFSEEQLESALQLRKTYSGLFDQVIKRGNESGAFSIEEPMIARMIVLGSMNWVQQWYRPEGRMSKEELQQIFARYILKLLK